MTATDIAIYCGITHIEGADKSKIDITPEQAQKALDKIVSMVEDIIDLMKTTSDPCDVIFVGGGSVLIPESAKLKGVSNGIKPEHFGCANALGAAIAQVSASIDRVEFMDDDKEETRLIVLNRLK